MCVDCWARYPEPAPVTPAITNCVEAIDAVYVESSVGGALHVVIDDWNVNDKSLNFCREYLETDAEHACWENLRGLSELERATALAIHKGHYAPP